MWGFISIVAPLITYEWVFWFFKKCLLWKDNKNIHNNDGKLIKNNGNDKNINENNNGKSICNSEVIMTVMLALISNSNDKSNNIRNSLMRNNSLINENVINNSLIRKFNDNNGKIRKL